MVWLWLKKFMPNFPDLRRGSHERLAASELLRNALCLIYRYSDIGLFTSYRSKAIRFDCSGEGHAGHKHILPLKKMGAPCVRRDAPIIVVIDNFVIYKAGLANAIPYSLGGIGFAFDINILDSDILYW